MKLCFGVSSVGLGHVYRSLLLARAIEALQPTVRIEWICGEPALSFFEAKGLSMHPVCHELASLSDPVERAARKGSLAEGWQLIRELVQTVRMNLPKVLEAVERGRYDAVVANECWEILLAYRKTPPARRPPIIVHTDFVRVSPSSRNPIERLALPWVNTYFKQLYEAYELCLMDGEPEDLPRHRWYGLFGERLRPWGEQHLFFTGPLSSSENEESEPETLRKALDASPGVPLILGTIGGTAVGAFLLRTLAAAHPLIERGLGKEVATLLVCGPRLSPSHLKGAPGVRAVGFIPDLYRYFPSCDCVVSLAGSGTLKELAANHTPAVIVPIGNHFEQRELAERYDGRANMARYAGPVSDPQSLAEAVLERIRAPRSTPPPAEQDRRLEEASRRILALARSRST